jgi:hypothetical protein
MDATTPEVGAYRAAIHTMVIALRSAALSAAIQGLDDQADSYRKRADLGAAALEGPDVFMRKLAA